MKLPTSKYVILALSFLIGSCTGKNQDAKQSSKDMNMSHGDHTNHAEMDLESGEPTDASIYNVSSTWKTRHNNEIKFSDLRGKIQVVAMVYTHCEYACPRILADMKNIEKTLSESALQSVNFTIISIDPERDTPQRLTEFATENNLSDAYWTLLNGVQGDILEIAALLGVKYKPISDTDFTHSNMITVLDKEGEVVHQRKKLQDRQTEIIKNIETLAAK